MTSLEINLRIKEWVVSEATGMNGIAQAELVEGEAHRANGRTLENCDIEG